MKFKRTLILAATALVLVGSYSAALRAGHDPAKLLAQARCQSGGLITHSTNVGAVAADSDTSDDVSINNVSKVAIPTSLGAVGDNLLPNPSFEAWSGTKPSYWNTNVYGANNATFTTVAGYNSPTAVRVEISNYTNGDADWYTGGLTVTPGQYYRYSDTYRSNVTTRAVLGLVSNGTTQYVNLASTPASSTWAQYSVAFFVPQNVSHIIIFHPLTSKGSLDTDNMSFAPATAQGFDQGLVSVTFDDGWKSIHDNALPVLKADNIVSTQYIISGYVGTTTAYMNAKDIYDFQAQGSEIASHTVDHADLTKQSANNLKYELAESQHDLSNCFGGITDFANPLGTYNSTTQAATAQVYTTGRSTDVGYNTGDSLNPYALKVQNVSSTTTTEQLAGWIQTAKQNHVWLILVYHQVDDSASLYARKPKDFAADMQVLKASGITVKTLHDAYAHVQPQLGNGGGK